MHRMYEDFDGAHFAQHVFHTSMNIYAISCHMLRSGKDDFEHNATRMLMYIQRSYISTCIYCRCIYFVIQGLILVCHKVL